MLLPLRKWLSDRSLEEALYEQVNSFGRMSHRCFQKTLALGQAIGIFDGMDEVYEKMTPGFYQQFNDIRKAYPQTAWSVSSRPSVPAPSNIDTVI